MSLFFLFAAQMSTMMAIVDIGLSMYSQKRLSAMMVDWALASTMEECVEGSDSFAVT
jgi:phage terminase large subunit-like protein